MGRCPPGGFVPVSASWCVAACGRAGRCDWPRAVCRHGGKICGQARSAEARREARGACNEGRGQRRREAHGRAARIGALAHRGRTRAPHLEEDADVRPEEVHPIEQPGHVRRQLDPVRLRLQATLRVWAGCRGPATPLAHPPPTHELHARRAGGRCTPRLYPPVGSSATQPYPTQPAARNLHRCGVRPQLPRVAEDEMRAGGKL